MIPKLYNLNETIEKALGSARKSLGFRNQFKGPVTVCNKIFKQKLSANLFVILTITHFVAYFLSPFKVISKCLCFL